MQINGLWVGWGLGDWSHNPDGSDRDPLIRRFKSFARRMYSSYMGHLSDSNVFDREMYDAVIEMQDRLVRSGRLQAGGFIRGVLDLPTQEASLFRKPTPKALPIIFTIEGHLSNMFLGPCASTASFLEGQQLCHWKPVGYDVQSIPFNNKSGRDSLLSQLNSERVEGPKVNGQTVWWPFPDDLNWGMAIFSQGAIIGSQVWMRNLKPATGGRLAARRDNLKRVVAYGNPYREKDVIAPWVPDPPRVGTQGISDERLVGTPSFWQEHSRKGDMYAENPDDEVGLNRSAVYKIISENSWSGGPAGILARVMDLFVNPFDGLIDMTMSLIGAGMFVVNMGPHGMYDLGPSIDWMRGVALD